MVVSSHVGWEEKELLRAAKQRGAEAVRIDPDDLQSFLLGEQRDAVRPPPLGRGAVALMRCPSYFASIEIAALLERHGLRTYNSSEALTRFGRKTTTDSWLFERKLPVVPSCVAFSTKDLEAIGAELGFPLVMKPSIGGFGRRVHVVSSKEQLSQAFEFLEDFAPAYHQFLYVQRKLDVAHDVRVNFVDGGIVAVMERINDDELAKNVARGGRGEPYSLDGRGKELMLELAKHLSRGFFGVDLLVITSGDCFVCEINASCNFRGASAASGVDIADRVVGAALEAPR